MLAQTQAERVETRYRSFIEQFATPEICASAAPGDVLRAWSGLGYNRRALQLHATARALCERHGGSVPRELTELLALSGVGPYTARAVLAFAFEEPVAVIDTNIGRVLARAVVGTTLSRSAGQLLAEQLLDRETPREWNLALMDFGALLCTARQPACASCPLRALCKWRRAGDVPDPAIGSAAVSTRQSKFEGSDRQGRGRIVKAAINGAITLEDLEAITGWTGDRERAERVLRQLVAEGAIIERAHGKYELA
jgi:A/G-specific adenine glycosylase